MFARGNLVFHLFYHTFEGKENGFQRQVILLHKCTINNLRNLGSFLCGKSLPPYLNDLIIETFADR